MQSLSKALPPTYLTVRILTYLVFGIISLILIFSLYNKDFALRVSPSKTKSFDPNPIHNKTLGVR